MIKQRFFAIFSFLSLFLCVNVGSAYYFWLKSFDNTVQNISQIESQYGVEMPVVSFIFDPRKADVILWEMDKMADELGRDKIYHITLSPNMYSAQEVADGAFDAEYLQFFEKIRQKNLKVIFRTMHEMNGGWYPRSSNPEAFKKAWIHVWNLSRTAGLDQSDILFDFSVNHRDMPTKAVPSQSAPLIQCVPDKTDCYHFEDYWPWDIYIDLVWFTFYNWGKATSSRQWLTPEQILFNPTRKTYERLQKLNKPLIIDEVWTTAVRYDWKYSAEKSREVYLQNTELKEEWLGQLQLFISSHPEILVAIYFNIDYTAWLQNPMVGEADWSIADYYNNRIYNWFFDLYQHSSGDINLLTSYFLNSRLVYLSGWNVIATKKTAEYLPVVQSLIDKKATEADKKAELIQSLLSVSGLDRHIRKSLEILAVSE